MERLLKAELPLVATGIQPGLNPLSAQFWADARNVHVTPYGIQAMRGYGALQQDLLFFDAAAGMFDAASGLFDDGAAAGGPLVFAGGAPIRAALAYRLESGVPRLVIATIDKVWKWDGAVSADLVQSGLAGVADDGGSNFATVPSVVSWGDWFILTNDIDPIKVYKTGASMANLGGTPPIRAKCLAKLGPHVIAFNTDLGANYAEWCGENAAEQWDATVEPTAGNLPVRDLENDIITAVPLGDGLAVYTFNEMQTMQYLGGTFQFGVKPLMEGIGALGVKSVASVGKINYGLYYNGIFRTDGYTSQIITDRDFARWLDKNVNLEQKSKIVAWHDLRNKQIKFCLPTNGSSEPNLMLGFNYNNSAFTLYDQGISAAAEAGTFKSAIVGTTGGRVFTSEGDDTSMTFDGAPINAWVRTKAFDLGDPKNWKVLQRIQVTMNDFATTGFEYRIGCQESLDDAMTWYGPYVVSAKNQVDFPANLSGIYLTLEFRSLSSAAQWTLEQFEIFGEGSGQEF